MTDSHWWVADLSYSQKCQQRTSMRHGEGPAGELFLLLADGGWGNRAALSLAWNGYNTVAAVTYTPDRELLAIPGFGPKLLTVTRAALPYQPPGSLAAVLSPIVRADHVTPP